MPGTSPRGFPETSPTPSPNEVPRTRCQGLLERLQWLEAITDEQLGSVVDVVLAHPEKAHSLDSLAELAGMSRSTFTDHFRKAFGRSPMDFVREVRLQRGARLLRTTDLSVKQIARRVGVHSRSHFTQAFSDLYGVSPKRYRLGAEAS